MLSEDKSNKKKGKKKKRKEEPSGLLNTGGFQDTIKITNKPKETQEVETKVVEMKADTTQSQDQEVKEAPKGLSLKIDREEYERYKANERLLQEKKKQEKIDQEERQKKLELELKLEKQKQKQKDKEKDKEKKAKATTSSKIDSNNNLKNVNYSKNQSNQNYQITIETRPLAEAKPEQTQPEESEKVVANTEPENLAASVEVIKSESKSRTDSQGIN